MKSATYGCRKAERPDSILGPPVNLGKNCRAYGWTNSDRDPQARSEQGLLGCDGPRPERRVWDAFLKHRWPVSVGATAGALVLVDDGVDGSEVTAQPAVVTLVVSAAYLPIGAFRRQLGNPRVLMLETAGVLVFGALTLGALLADARLAQCRLARAHGLGFRPSPGRQGSAEVVREICAALDALIAVGILLAVPHL